MSELKLKSDTAKRKHLFTAESFSHPAKMHIGLQEWLLQEYTKEGDVVLDPMAGSGSILIGTLMGRHIICVELEAKFVKMAEDNLKKLNQMALYLGTKERGTAVILQGDARNLTGLLVDKCIFSPPFAGNTGGLNSARNFKYGDDELGKRMMGGIKGGTGEHPDNIDNLPYKSVDKCIFSPPYTNRMDGGSKGDDAGMRPYTDEPRDTWRTQRDQNNIGNLPYGQVDKIVTSPPYAEADISAKQFRNQVKKGYFKQIRPNRKPDDPFIGGKDAYEDSKTSDSIGNLKYGEISAIVTSPPYSDQINAMHRSSYPREPSAIAVEKNLPRAYSTNPENIGNLPHGDIDAILTSPPYEEAMGEKHHSPRADKLAEEKSNPTTYTDKVDCVLTSPPYEGSLEGGSRHTHGGIPARDPRLGATGAYPYQDRKRDKPSDSFVAWQHGLDAQDNIGNLKSTSYLEAMSQVYAQCYTVLRPGGLMILVTKNFIRDQKEIRLDSDTIALCEQCGFVLKERHYRKLTQQSFWRIIYKSKYPSAPVLDKEDILIFVKTAPMRSDS